MDHLPLLVGTDEVPLLLRLRGAGRFGGFGVGLCLG